MSLLNKVDWLWFAVGIAFAMFIMPLISQFLGRMKGGHSSSKSA